MVDEKRSVAGHQIQLNTSFFGPQDTTQGTEFGMFSTVKFLGPLGKKKLLQNCIWAVILQ